MPWYNLQLPSVSFFNSNMSFHKKDKIYALLLAIYEERKTQMDIQEHVNKVMEQIHK
jgi:hypothetical protein